jgi:ketosteroid isomerase-like protein
MYTWMVGRIVRRTFARMSAGDYRAAADMFTASGTFRFPGSHELAGDYRGKAAVEGWFSRAWSMFDFDFQIQDVVVSGPPWNTRVGTRFTVVVTAADGTRFPNRGMQYVRLAWGKVVEDEIYEDTETVAREVAHAASLETSAV